jgi:hypothetical protein
MVEKVNIVVVAVVVVVVVAVVVVVVAVVQTKNSSLQFNEYTHTHTHTHTCARPSNLTMSPNAHFLSPCLKHIALLILLFCFFFCYFCLHSDPSRGVAIDISINMKHGFLSLCSWISEIN